MSTKIKTALLTAAALVMTAGVASAAPAKYHNSYGKPGYSKVYKKKGVSPVERAKISRSAANLAALKRRAMRDGRVTFSERAMIQNAERRHAALVARAYRT